MIGTHAPKQHKQASKANCIDFSKLTMEEIFSSAAHKNTVYSMGVPLKSHKQFKSKENTKRLSEILKKCPYNILGVDNDAKDDEINQAYKKNLLKAHPDKGGSQENFIQLQNAYKVLIDPTKRRIYNEYGLGGIKVLEQFGGIEMDRDEFESALRVINTN
jgi:DnaJ-domain-containing protein 1